MEYSSEELNVVYDKLPDQLKDIIFSVDTANVINNTGRGYNLHIDQIGELAEETGLVLLGLTHPTDFVSNITKRLGIDRVIASQIASDINDQVFLKVRELMKQAENSEVKKTEEETKEPLHPSRDMLLAAIENPDSLPKKAIPSPEIPLVKVNNPYAPAKPEMGKDFPVVAPVPPSATDTEMIGDTTSSGRTDLQSSDMLTQKLSGQFSLPKVETKMDANQITPGKKSDPYREQV